LVFFAMMITLSQLIRSISTIALIVNYESLKFVKFGNFYESQMKG
jgi:hypothetical protein